MKFGCGDFLFLFDLGGPTINQSNDPRNDRSDRDDFDAVQDEGLRIIDKRVNIDDFEKLLFRGLMKI